MWNRKEERGKVTIIDVAVDQGTNDKSPKITDVTCSFKEETHGINGMNR